MSDLPETGHYLSIGRSLIATLQAYIIDVMSRQVDCAPEGFGLRNSEIEELADLSLKLEKQDSYLTYSILMSMVRDGRVIKTGEFGKPRYRLR